MEALRDFSAMLNASNTEHGIYHEFLRSADELTYQCRTLNHDTDLASKIPLMGYLLGNAISIV